MQKSLFQQHHWVKIIGGCAGIFLAIASIFGGMIRGASANAVVCDPHDIQTTITYDPPNNSVWGIVSGHSDKIRTSLSQAINETEIYTPNHVDPATKNWLYVPTTSASDKYAGRYLCIPQKVLKSTRTNPTSDTSSTRCTFTQLTSPPPNICLGLVFNYNIKPSDMDQEKGFDYLWGGGSAKKSSGTYNTFYDPFDRSGKNFGLDTGKFTLQDFQNNFQNVKNLTNKQYTYKTPPSTWIVYQCDGKTPAWYADDQGNTDEKISPHQFVPLDITNPDVRQFKMNEFIRPSLQDSNNDYAGVAFDNVNLDNREVDTNTGKSETRCGTKDAHGHFTTRWDGGNTQYQNDVVQWATNIRTLIRDTFPSATMSVNFSFDYNRPETSKQLLDAVDFLSSEGGFTNFGNDQSGQIPYLTDKNWVTNVQEMIQFQSDNGKHDKGLMTIDEEPGTPHNCGDTIIQDHPEQVQWALASYMMVQDTYTYVDIMHQQEYGCAPVWLRTLRDNNLTGVPKGGVTPTPNPNSIDPVYSRQFTDALALVNPSATNDAQYNLGGTTYKDILGKTIDTSGKPYTGNITLKAHSGLVLFKSA